MRTKKNTTPIIILSNLSQEDDAKKAEDLGVVDFIIKSNTPLVEIVDCLKKILKV